MTRTFRRHGDAIRASFQPIEVELLRSMRDQLAAALDDPDPDDPVVQRLFPPAVLGDPEVGEEVSALLVDGLLASRRQGLDAVVEILDRGRPQRGRIRVDLVDEEPLLVLGVLNDVRLAIGARLDIEALDRSAVDPGGPTAHRLAVMDHLAWWQEQLLSILDPPSVAHAHEDDPGPGDPTGPRPGGPDGSTPHDPGGTAPA